jgi:plastocyanin
MRATLGILLLLLANSAAGASYTINLGVDCASVELCFHPSTLTVNVGDSVHFFIYGDAGDPGLPHNVVADDGSFRCAEGCDGEGGNGDPASYLLQWSFWRRFANPGTVHYHDEVSGATGMIIVQGEMPPFAIGPGMSGAWYDPNQSGQGLEIEILPNNVLYATWFSYNPSGSRQAWFTGVGTYGGTGAAIPDVEMPAGGRWILNFNPAEVVSNHWGTLSFTFTDCDHGQVTFDSTSGYGSGSMSLTRLTRPAGLGCP